MKASDNRERVINVQGFDAKELGSRVRNLRDAMGKSREWLAEQVGLSCGHIANIESGSKTTTVENVLLIAQALKTTPNYLMAQACDAFPNPEKEKRVTRIADLMREFDNDKLERFEKIALLWMNDVK